MLILDSTSTSLRVRLAAGHTTTPLRCVTSWRDTTTSAFTPGSTLASTNGTTGVEIAPSPAASTQRIVDFVSVLNTDTVTHTATIYIYDGATNFDMITVSLGVGERVEYGEGYGFQTYNAAGSLKTLVTATQNVKATGWSSVVLGADVTNNNATANTLADVTGMSFPVVNGTRYWFEFFIVYTAAATTTGSRWLLNGPTQSLLAYRTNSSLTATSRGFIEAVAYDTGTVTASSTATAGNIAVVEGFIQVTADGTLQLRFASEISSSAIVAKAGSMVRYIAVT